MLTRGVRDPRPAFGADLPHGPDPVAAWIRLDLLTRRVIGRHLELGATPATDEALDKLMVLRAWTARQGAPYSTRRPIRSSALREG
jgi:hypothetical protein